jgi:hypothetical protein
MKNTSLVLGLILMITSCSTKRYLLTDKGNDRYFLQQRIDESAKKGLISKAPMIVIDGHPYRYDVELKRQKLNLSHNNIKQIDVLKRQTAVNIYGEMGKRGVLLITTYEPNRDRELNPQNNVLVLLEGNKISLEDMNKIDPMDIDSVDIVKTKSEILKYTHDAYDGVIVIKLKKRAL